MITVTCVITIGDEADLCSALAVDANNPITVSNNSQKDRRIFMGRGYYVPFTRDMLSAGAITPRPCVRSWILVLSAWRNGMRWSGPDRYRMELIYGTDVRPHVRRCGRGRKVAPPMPISYPPPGTLPNRTSCQLGSDPSNLRASHRYQQKE